MLRTHPLVRYAVVAAIVLAVGGAFAYQQLRPGTRGTAAAGPGVIDTALHPALGRPAPDFALEEVGTGRLVRLSDYRGKTVILNFWATWCAPCRSEMPDFQRTFAARQARGDLVVLAVDDREAEGDVTAFVREFGLTFPVLMDRAGEVRVHYAVTGLPATLFIDRDGVIRSQNYGPVFGDLLIEGVRAADQGAGPASGY